MKYLSHAIVTAFIFSFAGSAFSQILDVSPAFPTSADVVTVVYDASEGNAALVGVGPVYCHAGLITSASTSPSNWLYVQGVWGTADPNVLMTSLGNNKHSITINIPQFYGFPNGTNVLKLAFVFRNAAGTIVGRSSDGSDIYYDVYPSNAGLLAAIFSPGSSSLLDLGQTLSIQTEANSNCTLSLYDNGTLLSTLSNATILNYSLTATLPGNHCVKLIASNGASTVSDSVYYTVNPTINYQNPPNGMKNGINYLNDSTVLLQLYAPDKNNVYVLGDFNSWQTDVNYYMNCTTDSLRRWLIIGGLTPGQKYGYQYYIDGILKIADPMSPLILDPNNDPNINALTYPNPHPYPTGLTTGLLTIMQPGAPNFSWQNDNFIPAPKKDLLIYELLVRDFVAKHNYQTIIDTLDYFSSLGINSIELMPPGEFENNESWGYNPSFHMALDKYYGSPEKFKELVDACHGRGIAVIVDNVLNHAFGQNSMVNMYWDAVNARPAANNPWFNTVCPHPPYCWGNDFNHSSLATQEYIDQVNRYWLSEYHVDGFRFDFTRGFVNASANYSTDRINILKRMADSIWAFKPNAYIILEHWCDNNEEKILAEYGMMLWGNVVSGYQNAHKGFIGNSNINNGIYSFRNWTVPHLITFMESHDEQRLMYESITNGNSTNPAHNAKDPYTALGRLQTAAVAFLTQPGPRMIWQFGEYGYDINIDYPCRICNKPILWNYLQQGRRQQIVDVYSATLKLRKDYATFRSLDFEYSLAGGIKRVKLNDPTMNALVLTNFDVNTTNAIPSFQHTGWWYEYFTHDSLYVSDVNSSLSLTAAEYRIYTDIRLNQPFITSVASLEALENPSFEFNLFPVPSTDFLNVSLQCSNIEPLEINIYDALGHLLLSKKSISFIGTNEIKLPVDDLANGTYLLVLKKGSSYSAKQFVK